MFLIGFLPIRPRWCHLGDVTELAGRKAPTSFEISNTVCGISFCEHRFQMDMIISQPTSIKSFSRKTTQDQRIFTTDQKKVVCNNGQLGFDCFRDNRPEWVNVIKIAHIVSNRETISLNIYLQNDTILFISSEACDWLAFCNRDRRMPCTMSWPWVVTTRCSFYKDKNKFLLQTHHGKILSRSVL